jgi:hypothetical protein
VNIADKGRDGPGNQHFHIALFYDAVIGGVPTADVGIDRYLRDSGRSGGHTYEVQSGATAFISYVRQRIFAE